jgi:hypothetical protein
MQAQISKGEMTLLTIVEEAFRSKRQSECPARLGNVGSTPCPKSSKAIASAGRSTLNSQLNILPSRHDAVFSAVDEDKSRFSRATARRQL